MITSLEKLFLFYKTLTSRITGYLLSLNTVMRNFLKKMTQTTYKKLHNLYLAAMPNSILSYGWLHVVGLAWYYSIIYAVVSIAVSLLYYSVLLNPAEYNLVIVLSFFGNIGLALVGGAWFSDRKVQDRIDSFIVLLWPYRFILCAACFISIQFISYFFSEETIAEAAGRNGRRPRVSQPPPPVVPLPQVTPQAAPAVLSFTPSPVSLIRPFTLSAAAPLIDTSQTSSHPLAIPVYPRVHPCVKEDSQQYFKALSASQETHHRWFPTDLLPEFWFPTKVVRHPSNILSPDEIVALHNQVNIIDNHKEKVNSFIKAYNHYFDYLHGGLKSADNEPPTWDTFQAYKVAVKNHNRAINNYAECVAAIQEELTANESLLRKALGILKFEKQVVLKQYTTIVDVFSQQPYYTSSVNFKDHNLANWWCYLAKSRVNKEPTLYPLEVVRNNQRYTVEFPDFTPSNFCLYQFVQSQNPGINIYENLSAEQFRSSLLFKTEWMNSSQFGSLYRILSERAGFPHDHPQVLAFIQFAEDLGAILLNGIDKLDFNPNPYLLPCFSTVVPPPVYIEVPTEPVYIGSTVYIDVPGVPPPPVYIEVPTYIEVPVPPMKPPLMYIGQDFKHYPRLWGHAPLGTCMPSKPRIIENVMTDVELD